MATTLVSLLLLSSGAKAALNVDLNSPESIKSACRGIADNLLSYYKGDQPGQIPGILPGPPPGGEYYWWEAGAMWGTLIDYWHYTGDNKYNKLIQDSLIFQAGPPKNAYMPANWTASLGNDDQGFWGLSAMLAAETKFQDPPKDQPQWLALAQAVWNTQAAPDRHDNTCGGGLRWQIPWGNIGFDYKNAIANGIFFNMGARLARYTNNDTYSKFAVETWDWSQNIGLISPEWDVYDGGHVQHDCKDIYKAQFSYNAAIYTQGAAFMYNYTNGSDIWRGRVTGLVNRTLEVFFGESGVAVEVACELPDKIQCKVDMLSFKGYLHRWLASTAQLVPILHDQIMKTLKTSTAAAIKSCNGNVCGFRWTTGSYDGQTGVGEQMNVLAALSSLLIDEKASFPPVTNATGGTSQGDVNAGRAQGPGEFSPITTADRAGAGILTVAMLTGLVGTVYWMSSGWIEGGGM